MAYGVHLMTYEIFDSMDDDTSMGENTPIKNMTWNCFPPEQLCVIILLGKGHNLDQQLITSEAPNHPGSKLHVIHLQNQNYLSSNPSISVSIHQSIS